MSSRALAPVVIFTYKRLPILRRVVDSLLANSESAASDLIVYSDGPKTPRDQEAVEEVRAYVRELRGFKRIELRFRERNMGLAQSFISGITETLRDHERAIFLEDDNLLSPHFLSFMNDALERYAADSRVICVTGYAFPIWPRQQAPYFVRGAETWSMATWRRGWANFNADAIALRQGLDALGLRVALDRSGFRFYQMLQKQINGEIDSWGVRWWVSAFLAGLYCLYPHEPLCVSIGYGADSVHTPSYNLLFRRPEDLAARAITEFPPEVTEKPWIPTVLRLMNLRIRWHTRRALMRARWRRCCAERPPVSG